MGEGSPAFSIRMEYARTALYMGGFHTGNEGESNFLKTGLVAAIKGTGF